jgi:hypothetical protein
MLGSEEKEQFEMQALSAKEKYHAELAAYKKTDRYSEYSKYLADFKAKHAAGAGEMVPFIADIVPRRFTRPRHGG